MWAVLGFGVAYQAALMSWRRFRGRLRAVDALTIFGLFAVSAMLVSYAFEDRSHRWILGFACACLLGSIYGFLQGAWPFGIVEAVWALVAARRWWLRRNA